MHSVEVGSMFHFKNRDTFQNSFLVLMLSYTFLNVAFLNDHVVFHFSHSHIFYYSEITLSQMKCYIRKGIRQAPIPLCTV